MSADLPFQGLRLLVLEDEPLIALMIADMLEDLGCVVVGPAGSVPHALALIERDPIDGALLDVSLGGGERSFPVAEELQKRNIPFVFVTGHGGAGLTGDFAAVQVLQKPFVGDHLRRVVSDGIAAAR